MTESLDLDPITAREAAATPGPWRAEAHAGLGEHGILGPANLPIGALEFGDDDRADADREFVIAARQDVPALLAEVRRLRAERDQYVGRLDKALDRNRRLRAELAAARERIAELTMTPRERANLRVQALVNAGDYEGACAAAEAFEANQAAEGV